MHSKLLATFPSIETFAKRPIGQLSQTGQNGTAFVTTHWSIVLTARGESPEASEALEKLCRNYWWPIYGFVRRQGHTPEEAQDLTQGFFAFLLERKGLDTVGPEKGRLRSFFLASVRNFLANAHRSAMAGKRGHGRPALSLEELVGREHAHLEPLDTLTADRIYEREWALTLLDQVLGVRDDAGKVMTVRYEAVNAMLLNEFLKEHKAFIEEQHKVETLEATVADLIGTTKEQAAQIQKVGGQLKASKPALQVVNNP